MDSPAQPVVNLTPKKFNIYSADGRKLTPNPINESQIESFRQQLQESTGGQVVVKELLFG